MDDLNLRFSTDSDRSGETGETENATRPLEEKTERASDEPTTATDAAPAMSPDEAGCQHPVADPPTLVTLEEKSESGLPVKRLPQRRWPVQPLINVGPTLIFSNINWSCQLRETPPRREHRGWSKALLTFTPALHRRMPLIQCWQAQWSDC